MLGTVNLDSSKASDKVLHDIFMDKVERTVLNEKTIGSISNLWSGYAPNKLLKLTILLPFTNEEMNSEK